MRKVHGAARAFVALCSSVGALACGGASMLRGPIADRCASADLEGCDDISDGVVLVVSSRDEP